ncbi:MAG: U32 family peptidase [Flavobacteriales bacterium]|jgi:putative protease|nr:U32 family peptidase [Flavobacteriales bacterium]
MSKVEKLELMAPAGGFDSLQAALDNGADSVYFGVDQLNMRARATMNFTLGDLEEIAERCNERGVRSYLTLNAIIYNHDLSLIKTVVNRVKEAGITAIIASDQAVIGYAKSQGVDVHISTQLNVTNIETVKFYALFANVMVLSRELSLRQVKEICDAVKKEDVRGPNGELVKIEVFGHGALCMAVSGKCYLSLHTSNSSANRGACVQNCRRKYKVVDLEDGHELELDNEYIMSPKDLCTIDFLDQLIDTGISVLKIEGRGRAPEYVATTIKAYREAIDAYYEGTYTPEKVKEWFSRLETVYNRGFWGGYFLGQELGEWTDASGSKATVKKVFLGKGLHYYGKPQIGEFKIEAQFLSKGDKILITGPTTGVIETTVEEMRVNNEVVDVAKRGEEVTFFVDKVIRSSDKLYKVVAAEEVND